MNDGNAIIKWWYRHLQTYFTISYTAIPSSQIGHSNIVLGEQSATKVLREIWRKDQRGAWWANKWRRSSKPEMQETAFKCSVYSNQRFWSSFDCYKYLYSPCFSSISLGHVFPRADSVGCTPSTTPSHTASAQDHTFQQDNTLAKLNRENYTASEYGPPWKWRSAVVENKDDVSPEDNSVLSPPALSLLAIPNHNTQLGAQVPNSSDFLHRLSSINMIAVDLLHRLPPGKFCSQFIHLELLLGRKRCLGMRMKMWIRSCIKLIGQNHLS